MPRKRGGLLEGKTLDGCDVRDDEGDGKRTVVMRRRRRRKETVGLAISGIEFCRTNSTTLNCLLC